MTNWREALGPLLDSGERCVLVTVAEVRGSAPRERGATMLVTGLATVDTIGGGTLEYEAIAAAREVLDGRAAPPWLRRYPLGPALGQCCGGQVTLLFEPIAPDARPAWVDDPAADVRTVVADGRSAPFVQALNPPRLELLVFGAGHVGRATVNIAAMQPWNVQWIDSRAEQFFGQVPPDVQIHCVAEPCAAVDTAPTGAVYLVMTHSHPLDLAVVARILARGDAGYCGLIGSVTKRRRFDGQLAALGLADAAAEQLHCPLGVPGVQSRRPAAIAVAAIAEILATPSLAGFA